MLIQCFPERAIAGMIAEQVGFVKQLYVIEHPDTAAFPASQLSRVCWFPAIMGTERKSEYR